MSEVIISTISKNYAQALLDSLGEISYADVLKDLRGVEEAINSSEDLQIVLSNSSISLAKKLEIIDTLFRDKINSKTLNFIKILIEQNRFSEYSVIICAFEQLVDSLSRKKTVTIIAPIKLTFENKTNILFKLERKLNCEINPIWQTDESIIAGLVFKFDDYIIDTSAKAKLEAIGKIITK